MARIRKSNEVALAYLMLNDRNGLVKIGQSTHPEYREKTLQGEDPHTFLLALAPDGIVLERHLHQAYSHARVRGEWFRLSPSEMRTIVESHSFTVERAKRVFYDAFICGLSFEEYVKRELIRQVEERQQDNLRFLEVDDWTSVLDFTEVFEREEVMVIFDAL